ncbi:MAG: sugar transferase [Clostridiales bacterium]|nr:sugar transferase [Clostridiales bacterium]
MNLFLKRLFDIVSALILFILLIPAWMIVSIAIKADSKGPVLFRQDRRTKDGRVFQMLKFRTMVMDAEHMGAGLFVYEDDTRLTKVGRFLRNTSIDELPQILNILRGDMSVVGPRPCVKYELGDFDTLNSTYKKRFQMKAGLTGLAQCSERNDCSWDKKVVYDNEYIDLFRKKGILIDIKILFKTLLLVFSKKNVYETKADESMTAEEAAKAEEERIIRLAHLPDGEENK